jgi:hypothetical protein
LPAGKKWKADGAKERRGERGPGAWDRSPRRMGTTASYSAARERRSSLGERDEAVC